MARLKITVPDSCVHLALFCLTRFSNVFFVCQFPGVDKMTKTSHFQDMLVSLHGALRGFSPGSVFSHLSSAWA